jgi:hypothetical protein
MAPTHSRRSRKDRSSKQDEDERIRSIKQDGEGVQRAGQVTENGQPIPEESKSTTTRPLKPAAMIAAKIRSLKGEHGVLPTARQAASKLTFMKITSTARPS